MGSIDTAVLTALITAAVSLAVALGGFIATRSNQRDLALLKENIDERSARRNARLDYEYDARKRLYQECGPLIFELSERSAQALGRISGFARTAADGDLEPGPTSWLGRGYYSLSSYYRLLSPLAVGKVLQRRLTHLDLSLDPRIHWQYALTRQLADSFTDDFDLARVAGQELPYDPHDDGAETKRKKDPQVYWQQGVPRGILDNAVTALILREPEGVERVMDFAEFQQSYDREVQPFCDALDRIGYLLDGFHPRSRPVLWRILLAQAHLYRALIKSQQAKDIDPDFWAQLWGAEGRPDFDWRSPKERDGVPDSEIQTAVSIGESYTRKSTQELLAKLSGSQSP